MQGTDRERVRLCLDGHPEVFRELVGRYQAPLLAYLGGRLGDFDRAEEAAQETFVRSYFALSRLKKPESFFSWLFGIANRVVKEENRSRRRQNAAAEALREKPARRQPPVDYELERKVAGLGAPYREVVLLRFYGGLSCAEVSERLGIPLGTVTKRLSRAYALLRERLQRREGAGKGSEVRK